MRTISLYVSLACCVFGQSATDLFSKAPPAVDAALRARIAQFYQLHVDGKYRQAEALVAEQSKDFFYATNKPKYLGFEIKDIAWSENFTRAKATVITKMTVMMPGFADKPVPVPTPSRWKLVNGDWYWYVDEDDLAMTPFGRMKGGTAPAPPQGTAMPSQQEIDGMLRQVQADKSQVQLNGDEASSAQFVIANGMRGKISLALEAPHAPGFDARLDATEVEPGAKATVTVAWKPGDYRVPRFANMTVRVKQTNQAIPLHVTFVKSK